jgi:hypothetical protein
MNRLSSISASGPRVLLLGAGFSRNWGGWLASEAFEYLIGLPDLQREPEVIELLWQHQPTGGFEGALAELQKRYSDKKRRSIDHVRPLYALQDAISRMFYDMNRGYLEVGFGLVAHMRALLSRFDAIFTLNQDILLERCYWHNASFAGLEAHRWAGCYLPGISAPRSLSEFEYDRWLLEHWTVLNEIPERIDSNLQPIFKLHGSSLWRRQNASSDLLIIGGQKHAAISNDPLLKRYNDIFRNTLTTENARLMVIGYGYKDEHINRVVREGEHSGLKIFNISPEGADAWTETPNSGPGSIRGRNFLEPMLIGASRRSILEGADPSKAEYQKINRFFG